MIPSRAAVRSGAVLLAAALFLVHPSNSLAADLGVSDDAGGSIFAWSSAPGRVLLQRVDPFGIRQWPVSGVPLTTLAVNQVSTALVRDGAGGVIATWLDSRTGYQRVYAQRIDATGARRWGDDGIAVSPANAYWSQDVESDGAGGAFVAWSDTRGPSPDVFVQHFDANGSATWTAGGVKVAGTADQENGPRLEPDGSGGVIVAWTSAPLVPRVVRAQHLDASGSPQWGAEGILFYEKAGVMGLVTDGAGGAYAVGVGDGGDRFITQRVKAEGTLPWGPDGVVLAEFETNVTSGLFPEIVPDGEQGLVASWRVFEFASGRRSLVAVRLDASGVDRWGGGGTRVGDIYEADGSPRMVPDGTGGAVFAWSLSSEGSMNVFVQRLAGDASRPWGDAPLPVCTEVGYQAPIALVGDGAGGAMLAWSDWRHSGGNGDVYAQNVTATGLAVWRPQGRPVYLERLGQRSPALVSRGAPGSFLAWLEVVDGVYEIRAQRVGADGAREGTLHVLSDLDVHKQAPLVEPDGSGGALVAWVEVRPGDGSGIYVQRLDADGEPRWGRGGVRASPVTDLRGTGWLRSDGAGGAFLGIADRVLRAQHLDAAGVLLWGADGTLVSSAPQTARSGGVLWPHVTPDGAGGMFVVWGDGRWYDNHCIRGCGYAVMAQHLNSSGVPQWQTDGIVLRSRFQTNSLYVFPDIASDGLGGFFAVWSSREPPATLYAQHVDAAGAVAWIEDGVPISAAGAAEQPSIVATAPGRAVVAWADVRLGPQRDLYAQQLAFPGPALWSAGGVPLCTESGDQLAPRLAADGAGGAIAVWTDSRADAAFDVFAQRVNSSGARLWDPAGVAVSTGPGGQLVPDLAAAPDGGATFAWQDGRTGFEPVLGVARLGPGGTLVTAAAPGVVGVAPGAGALRLEPVRPNPTAGEITVRFALPDAGTARIELLDLAGRRVLSEAIAAGTAGAREIGLRTSGVRPGVYLVRLTHASGVRMVKAAVMR